MCFWRFLLLFLLNNGDPIASIIEKRFINCLRQNSCLAKVRWFALSLLEHGKRPLQTALRTWRLRFTSALRKAHALGAMSVVEIRLEVCWVRPRRAHLLHQPEPRKLAWHIPRQATKKADWREQQEVFERFWDQLIWVHHILKRFH